MSKFLIVSLFLLIVTLDPHDMTPIRVDNANELVELGIIYQSDPSLYSSPIDLAFIPNTQILAFIDGSSPIDNGPLLFYDIEKSAMIDVLDEPYEPARVISNEDGTRLFTGNREGEIRVFDLQTGELINQFSANNEVIEAIAISEDGQYIATASTNSVAGEGIYAFGLFSIDGEVFLQRDLSLGDGSATTFIENTNQIAYITIDNSNIGTVRLLDRTTGQQLSSCDNSRRIRDLISYSDGHFLLYAANDGVRKWDLRPCETELDAWSLLAQVPDHEYIHTMALNPTETVLAVGGTKSLNSETMGFIRLFDLTTGDLLKAIEIPFTENMNDYPTIYTLAFSPDGTLLASGGQDGTVRLWGITARE